MKLKVPVVIQEKDSVECGLAGLAMVMRYHNINVSVSDLVKEISLDKIGSYAPQLGVFLLNRGFSVEIITLNPGLFALPDVGKDAEAVLTHLKQLQESTKKDQDKKVIDYFIDFVGEGGILTPRIPKIDDVRKDIDAGNPVGALLTTNFFWGKDTSFNFHFNIITGYDEKHVFVNDPLWDERGGKHTFAIDDFFYGLYASAYGDLDNACLICVRKNK